MELVRLGQIRADVGMVWLLRQPPPKGSSSFMDLELGGGGRGKARSGKVLGAESRWRKMSLRIFPSFSPQKEASTEALKNSIYPKPLRRRARHEGARVKMQKREMHWPPEGPSPAESVCPV